MKKSGQDVLLVGSMKFDRQWSSEEIAIPNSNLVIERSNETWEMRPIYKRRSKGYRKHVRAQKSVEDRSR